MSSVMLFYIQFELSICIFQELAALPTSKNGCGGVACFLVSFFLARLYTLKNP